MGKESAKPFVKDQYSLLGTLKKLKFYSRFENKKLNSETNPLAQPCLQQQKEVQNPTVDKIKLKDEAKKKSENISESQKVSQENKALREKYDEAKKQIKNLEQKLSASLKAKPQTNGDPEKVIVIKHNKIKLNDKMLKIQKLEQELKRAREENTEKISALQKTIETLNYTNNASTLEMLNLKSKLEDTTTQLQKSLKTVEKQKHKLFHLEIKISRKIHKETEHTAKIKSLQENLQNLENLRDNLQEKLKITARQLENAQNSIKRKNIKICGFALERLRHAQVVKTHTAELELLQANIRQLEETLSSEQIRANNQCEYISELETKIALLSDTQEKAKSLQEICSEGDLLMLSFQMSMEETKNLFQEQQNIITKAFLQKQAIEEGHPNDENLLEAAVKDGESSIVNCDQDNFFKTAKNEISDTSLAHVVPANYILSSVPSEFESTYENRQVTIPSPVRKVTFKRKRQQKCRNACNARIMKKITRKKIDLEDDMRIHNQYIKRRNAFHDDMSTVFQNSVKKCQLRGNLLVTWEKRKKHTCIRRLRDSFKFQ